MVFTRYMAADNPTHSIEVVEKARFIFQIQDSTNAGSLEVKQFIRHHFKRCYNADIHDFCPMLLSAFNRNGELVAAVGYRYANSSALFLEQYLDKPIERIISTQMGQTVKRDEIVEVGNLACARPGLARSMIVELTSLLRFCGFNWVAFTGTNELLNSFKKLKLHPHIIATADEAKLKFSESSWGTYYQSFPSVMYGNINEGYTRLQDLQKTSKHE